MKKFTFLFLLLTGIFSFAQEQCRIRGEVLDSIGIPIYDASVSVFNSQGSGEGFTFTDREGFFELNVPCGDTYDLEIEHMSIESYSEQIELKSNFNKKIQVSRSTDVKLEELVIKARQPIVVKGDTIEYDAESFRTPQAETLEDILKQLPGLTVEDGKVYHKGKEITTITVGGREVLGGNTKLLNKNLPADAVDKIQLNQKFKQNPFSSSLQEDEQASLNIELKEDKKNLIFGNVTIGGDAQDHSDIQEKLFYFSPKTDGTLITDFNTFGKQVFDREDYFSFFGGIAEFSEEGSIFSLRNSTSGVSFGQSMNMPDMNLFLSAAHFGYEPNKKLFVNGFGLVNNNNISYRTTIERIYNTSETDLRRLDNQHNEESLLSAMGRVRLDYNINDKSQLKYRVNLSYSETESNQEVETMVNDLFDGYSSNVSQRKNYNLSQNLSYIRKVGKDDNLGIYIRHQYVDEKPDWWSNSTTQEFIGLSNVLEQDGVYNILQNQKLINNTLQLYGIYNHLFNNTTNLKLKIGSNISWQKFENEISTYGVVLNDDKEQADSDFTFNQNYAELTLTKKWGDFTAHVGGGVHNFNEDIVTFYDRRDYSETRFLPHTTLEYAFNSASRLRFTYRQEYQFPNIRDLTESYIISNYFAMNLGNIDLKRNRYHTLNLNYSLFNSFKFFNLNFNLGYTQNVDNIQTASFFDGTSQVNVPINNPRSDKTYSFSLWSQKRFNRTYSIRGRANLNYSDYFTYVAFGENITSVNDFTDANLINNKSFTQMYNLANIFKYRKKVELQLGLEYSKNDFRSTRNSDFVTWRPFSELAYAITDKFLLLSDYSFRIQDRDGERINEAQVLNASLRWNFMRMTYLTFTAGNILGNDYIATSSFNDNFSQVTTQEVLGRYFLLQLRFKF